MYRIPYQIKLLLVIIPLSLFILGLIYVRNSGLYFLKSVDPEYGYLLNGAALACFKFDLQFITNPGIPVHFITAIVIGIVHLFRPELPLLDDVVVNPEFYIRAILYTINGINAISLFILGISVFHFTKNAVSAVFLQLMILTNLLTIEATARLMPEALMLAISVCWIIIIFRWLYNYKSNYSLIFGFLISLSVTDKLTFLPYFFLPLILLENWRERMKFLIYGIIFFIILGYPLVLNHHFFSDWVIGIIGHTGPYGQGDTGFAKADEFFSHLMALIRYTPFLFWGFIILLSVSIVYKIKANFPIPKVLRLDTALVLLVLFLYLMASKQFAFHYLIPSILLTPLIYFMVFKTIAELFSIGRSAFLSTAMALVGIVFIMFTGPKMKDQMQLMRTSSNAKAFAYQKIYRLLHEKPLIVSPSYYGCSSVEYALTYGLHVSGKNGDFLFKTIQKHYPDVFMYFPWGNTFYKGNHEIKAEDFIIPEKGYRLYMADYNTSIMKIFRDRVESSFPGFKTKVECIDSINSEFVFDLRIIQANY